MSMMSSPPNSAPRNNQANSARLRGARSTRRAGGVQDSGNMLGEDIYTGFRNRDRSIEDVNRGPLRRGIPRQDESVEAQNFARILFGPGALQGRGGSGYQGLNTENMQDAARAMALQSRMQMTEEPRVRDMPNMTTEETALYNRPADDINDAFFGPDRERFDIIEFIMGLIGRGK